MLNVLQNWNKRLRKLLWLLVIIGLIAAMPIAYERIQTENSTKQVEFLFDYRDLTEVAALQTKPREFVHEQLLRLKDAGLTTAAVYESTLDELQISKRLEILSSKEAALLSSTVRDLGDNFTYVLFADANTAQQLSPMVENAFARTGVATSAWTLQDHSGLIIELPPEVARIRTMEPDPITLSELRQQGFQIVARLSNRIKPYNEQKEDKLLESLSELGVKRIIFDGDAVTGYDPEDLVQSKKDVDSFAKLLKKYDIGVTTIETSKPQAGLNRLAYLIDYNIARVYSLPDKDATLSPQTLIDRFALAAKDRNIRMFFINMAASKDLGKGAITDPIDNLIQTMQGTPDQTGALQRLVNEGFPIGPAEPFHYVHSSWQPYAKMLVLLGAVALVALCAGSFFPLVLLPVFVLGLIGTGGLYVMSKTLLEQGMALIAGIAAATLAVLLAIRNVRGRHKPVTAGAEHAEASTSGASPYTLSGGAVWVSSAAAGGSAGTGAGTSAKRAEPTPEMSVLSRLRLSLGLYLGSFLVSLVGAGYVIGLLNNITYSLVLEQFRGVSLLHIAPIALVALYVILFTGEPIWVKLRKLLNMNITVLWVIAAGIIGAAGLYYLSRTGNEGQASAYEKIIRVVLEDTFGVRPRFKEFMIAHPLFVLGIYLSIKYRAAIYMYIIGALGMLSVVDTFAHIHTPIHISLIRVVLGIVLGAIIGLVWIAIWEIAERCWKRWVPRLRG